VRQSDRSPLQLLVILVALWALLRLLLQLFPAPLEIPVLLWVLLHLGCLALLLYLMRPLDQYPLDPWDR